MKAPDIPLDFDELFGASWLFDTDRDAGEILFVTGVDFGAADLVVIPSRGGTMVDCTNGVVLRSLLLRLVIGGRIGVVDCLTERTAIHSFVRELLRTFEERLLTCSAGRRLGGGLVFHCNGWFGSRGLKNWSRFCC
jgi:hypothetical protein